MANNGTFRKGDPRAGRPIGSANKLTRDLRQMILNALSEVGGQDYLAVQAEVNPAAFLALVGRCLPKAFGPKPSLKMKINLVSRDGPT
jgi:hypothetical protein